MRLIKHWASLLEVEAVIPMLDSHCPRTHKRYTENDV